MRHVSNPLRLTRLGDTSIPNPDGVTLGVHVPVPSYMYEGTAPIDEPTSLAPETAAKLAVAQMLFNFTAYDVRFKQLLGGDLRPAQPIQLDANSVSLDWHEAGVGDAPLKMVIQESGEGGFSYDGLGLSGADWLEETVDKFGKGTVVMHESDISGTIEIEVEVASGSARDAVRKALRRLFTMEPNDTRGGRRIVFTPYYDAVVRMTLADRPFATDNDPTAIAQGKYGLTCYLEVELPGLRLVRAPDIFQTNPVVPTP